MNRLVQELSRAAELYALLAQSRFFGRLSSLSLKCSAAGRIRQGSLPSWWLRR